MSQSYSAKAIFMLDTDIASGATDLSEWREELSDREMDDIFVSTLDVSEMEEIHAAVIRAVWELSYRSKTLGDIIFETLGEKRRKEVIQAIDKKMDEEARFRATKFYDEAYTEKQAA